MEIALTWVCNLSPAGGPWGGPQNFPFLLNKKKSILLLAPSSIPVDALFQCTCPLLVASFPGHLSWHMTADTCSLCYTVVHFTDNFIGDLADESAL